MCVCVVFVAVHARERKENENLIFDEHFNDFLHWLRFFWEGCKEKSGIFEKNGKNT
jgi:hypothetical protein